MTNAEGIINGIEREVCGHCICNGRDDICLKNECHKKLIKDALYKTIKKNVIHAKDKEFPICPVCKNFQYNYNADFCDCCGNRINMSEVRK